MALLDEGRGITGGLGATAAVTVTTAAAAADVASPLPLLLTAAAPACEEGGGVTVAWLADLEAGLFKSGLPAK